MAKMGRKPFSDSMGALARKRLERGWSQRELAEAAGCKMRSIHKWESGAGYPSVRVVRAVAKVFGCTMDELFDEWE